MFISSFNSNCQAITLMQMNLYFFYIHFPNKIFKFAGNACTINKKKNILLFWFLNIDSWYVGREKLKLLFIRISQNWWCSKEMKTLSVNYVSNAKDKVARDIFVLLLLLTCVLETILLQLIVFTRVYFYVLRAKIFSENCKTFKK